MYYNIIHIIQGLSFGTCLLKLDPDGHTSWIIEVSHQSKLAHCYFSAGYCHVQKLLLISGIFGRHQTFNLLLFSSISCVTNSEVGSTFWKVKSFRDLKDQNFLKNKEGKTGAR